MDVNIIMDHTIVTAQYDITMQIIPRIGEKIALVCFLNGKDLESYKKTCDVLRDSDGRKGLWYEVTVKDVRYLRHTRKGDYVQLVVRWE
jgi:hypothetical protein